ncbi:hypothetical protein OXPF_17500 [Oxobacter pfennigii]|uniref:Translational regulator CsrA n=1 Tax=Oxobacter pfennigii TaxID=36849 RepID=A0A0N8NTF2_9CLOT|nr:carbon storage regulator CsrA [Oxobacter pfennigii]KPU44664.1 hypothetical protein OXPF_17500 [Oxobacter pfennigii]
MLVVTRKQNQSLIINGNIEIIIIEARDGSVKIGVEAPRDVKIYRKEIFEEIRDENKSALNTRELDIKELIKKED